jgi:hypothetical protein
MILICKTKKIYPNLQNLINIYNMKKKKTAPMEFLIDFFASVYDLIIAFFASLYDLTINFIKLILKIKKFLSLDFLIVFFAFQYDAVFNFGKFIYEYLKWIIDTRAVKSTVFLSQENQLIQIHN